MRKLYQSLSVKASDNGDPKYKKQALTELRGEITNSTIIVDASNNIGKDTESLNAINLLT